MRVRSKFVWTALVIAGLAAVLVIRQSVFSLR
jgi:hypothetical protein